MKTVMNIESQVENIVYDAYQMYTGKPSEGANDPFPMYSYNSPCGAFWRGFVRKLCADGLDDKQIKNLLKSKHMRWMFDEHSGKIEELAMQMAEGFASIAKDFK